MIYEGNDIPISDNRYQQNRSYLRHGFLALISARNVTQRKQR